jgi:hypothetical protein
MGSWGIIKGLLCRRRLLFLEGMLEGRMLAELLLDSCL